MERRPCPADRPSDADAQAVRPAKSIPQTGRACREAINHLPRSGGQGSPGRLAGELLAGRLVELKIADAVSYETVANAWSRKCPEALAEGARVHPAAGRRCLRQRDGRHPGLVPPAFRSPSAGLGRNAFLACIGARIKVKKSRARRSRSRPIVFPVGFWCDRAAACFLAGLRFQTSTAVLRS